MSNHEPDPEPAEDVSMGQDAQEHGQPPECDSPGYRIDSDGYQGKTESHVRSAEPDDGLELAAELEMSLESEYDFALALQRRRAAVARGDVPRPRGGWFPEPSDVRMVMPLRARQHQVNFRLDDAHWGALKRAARLYGETPTGMARQIVARGLESILLSYREEMREPEDPAGADEEDWGA